MTVLGIDTSARRRLVCVLTEPGGDLLRSVVAEDVDVDLALPPALAAWVDGGLETVVVTVGPGSYTGVRAGMAAALGVAHAGGLPLHGVSSLEITAAGAAATAAERGWAVVAAGRGALFAAPFDDADTAEWSHVPLSAFEPGEVPVFSTDDLGVPGLRRVDPVVGLARAVPLALRRSPLAREGLRAAHPA